MNSFPPFSKSMSGTISKIKKENVSSATYKPASSIFNEPHNLHAQCHSPRQVTHTHPSSPFLAALCTIQHHLPAQIASATRGGQVPLVVPASAVGFVETSTLAEEAIATMAPLPPPKGNAASASDWTTTLQTAMLPQTGLSPRELTRYGLQLPASVFVSPSMVFMDAANPHAGREHIHARNVVLSNILANPTLRNQYFPIVTPLRPKRWEQHLKRAGILEEFSDVPIGIRDGWQLGYNEPLISTFTPPNHTSALQNPDIVRTYIAREIAAGHYSQAFHPSQMMTSLFGYYSSFAHWRSLSRRKVPTRPRSFLPS